MVKVLASGVFDILHPGHLYYLTEARKLGDYLVVVVASDCTATALKRPPLHSAEQRAELVRALKVVDEVIIGFDTFDALAMLHQIQPQIIALGFDQERLEGELAGLIADSGQEIDLIRIPRCPSGSVSTSQYFSDISEVL
ncbi:MAG: adenylyltransferase/cytidyltransferase family protein [bacterium]